MIFENTNKLNGLKELSIQIREDKTKQTGSYKHLFTIYFDSQLNWKEQINVKNWCQIMKNREGITIFNI